jgi:two-component system response regulator NreC
MIRVFIVEDHVVVRAGLESLLKAEDNVSIVGMAQTGNEALQMLTGDVKADVLMTDLHLGDMSGIELAGSIRQRRPEIKILILTMDSNERYLSEAFKSGVKGYLLKEAGADELLYGIKKVSEGRHFLCSALTGRLTDRLSRDEIYQLYKPTDIELSSRESEILNLLSDGYTNLQIATKLFTSKRTVEGHRQSLLNKTGVRNTPELIKYAMQYGLLKLSDIN